jgi:hypothetical protein
VLVAARIPRYLALAYLGQQLGEKNSEAWLKSHIWQLLGLAALIGLASYLLVRRAERVRDAGPDDRVRLPL